MWSVSLPWLRSSSSPQARSTLPCQPLGNLIKNGDPGCRALILLGFAILSSWMPTGRRGRG